MTMRRKNRCPECDGKGYKLAIEKFGYCWEEDYEVKETQYQCGECRGAGEISDLEMAIYKARGGSAPPPPIKGFA